MSEHQAPNSCLDLHQEEGKQEERFVSNPLHLLTTLSPCPTCGCCSASSPPSPQKQKKQKIIPLETITATCPSCPCRCVSDQTEFGNDSISPDATNPSLNVVGTPESKQSQSLPPRPRSLHRTVSDPSNIITQSTIDKGRGNAQYQRLKKMKEYMEEMTKWWDKILPEKEKEDEEERKQEQENEEDNAAEEIGIRAVKDNSMTNGEETVSVERVGECMIIHFKCPCGKSYQILTSRGKCYYMLM